MMRTAIANRRKNQAARRFPERQKNHKTKAQTMIKNNMQANHVDLSPPPYDVQPKQMRIMINNTIKTINGQ